MGKGIINPGSRWEIVLGILRGISEEEKESEGKAKKTRFMQMAYLDVRNFQRYFDFLLEQGFVARSNSLEEGMSYELTEKGKDLLRILMEVEDILRQTFYLRPPFIFSHANKFLTLTTPFSTTNIEIITAATSERTGIK